MSDLFFTPHALPSDCNCSGNAFNPMLDCASQGMVPNVDGICTFVNSDNSPPFYVNPNASQAGHLDPAMRDMTQRPPTFAPMLPF